MNHDEFGNRMKQFEAIEARRLFLPTLPVVVRLDGKCFSFWTRGLNVPYDTRMIDIMRNVTMKLVEETNALIGYTQSDEITLLLYSDDITKPIYFGGRISKIISVLSSVATYWFNHLVQQMDFPQRQRITPAYFDCRAWAVPSRTEAVNSLLWREFDATRNSIYSAARTFYSHEQLHKCKKPQLMDLLMEHGVNWNDYPSEFKRGIYIQKRLGTISQLDLPPMNIVANRVQVVFDKHDPALIDDLTLS